MLKKLLYYECGYYYIPCLYHDIFVINTVIYSRFSNDIRLINYTIEKDVNGNWRMSYSYRSHNRWFRNQKVNINFPNRVSAYRYIVKDLPF